MFLATERLVVRRFRAEDAPAFAAYRSDPEVPRYQEWTDDLLFGLLRSEWKG